MKFPTAFAVFAVSALAASPIVAPTAPPGDPGQVFVLQDYRWVPVIVRRTPTAIECRFEVVTGQPTVHVELVTESDFGLFSRHRAYQALEATKSGNSGGFARTIDTAGRYRVLIRNDRGAPPAAVSLLVRTEVDPPFTTSSIGVTPRRRLVVILASMTLFIGTVLWSGRKLLRAYKNR